nr:hypothetical protein [Tanacetum cinerariifolium]
MSDDDAIRAESPPRGVASYYRPGNFEDPSLIVYPAAANGAVSNFKIQPNLIAIFPVFRGHEEPYVHLREFFSIEDTYQVNNTTKDGDFITNDEIVVEGKKDDNMKFDSDLLNDLLKDFPKPPTRNPKATKSPKDREDGVSSTTTPYPEALEKSASTRLAKKGPHSEDMWETFKQVKINLPLIYAIKKIPAYAKFLMGLCTQKKKLKATFPKKIDLTDCSGNIIIKKALLDLGASINILPASLVDKYDVGTLRKTDTIISLADRSPKIPRGILEDVIVKFDDFYYLVNFFVMDTEKLRLNVFNSLNSPISKDCYHIDTIDECIQTHTSSMNLDRTLENLHYVDSEKELFDGMTFHEKE